MRAQAQTRSKRGVHSFLHPPTLQLPVFQIKYPSYPSDFWKTPLLTRFGSASRQIASHPSLTAICVSFFSFFFLFLIALSGLRTRVNNVLPLYILSLYSLCNRYRVLSSFVCVIYSIYITSLHIALIFNEIIIFQPEGKRHCARSPLRLFCFMFKHLLMCISARMK